MPYAPGIQDISGQLWAQGIGQAGQALGAKLDRLGEEEKRTLQNGKIADAAVKANPEVLQTLGMSPERFGTLSAEDKWNSLTGLLWSQGYQKGQMDVQQEAAMAPLRQAGAATENKIGQARLSALQQEAADRAARNEALRKLGQSITPDMDAKQAGIALLKSGVSPRDAEDYTRVLQVLGRPDVTPGDVREIPGAPDYLGVVSSPSGSMTVIPRTRNPEKAGKVYAPAEPWVTADDLEEFKKGLRGVKDPAVRDAALAARKQWNEITGKQEDGLTKLIEAVMSGQDGGKGARGGAENPEKKGKERIRVYNPKTGMLE